MSLNQLTKPILEQIINRLGDLVMIRWIVSKSHMMGLKSK